jgi:iron(III) transport system substrate-binding protein
MAIKHACWHFCRASKQLDFLIVALSGPILFLIAHAVLPSPAFSQAAWKGEWEQAQAAAKQEGKVVVNIPPSAELRKALETVFKQRFGIEVELVPGLASKMVPRIADEHKAGVRYFDVVIAHADNLIDRLIPMGAVEPLEPNWILPEVKEAKNWWGGHFWSDKAQQYAYEPSAYLQKSIWYNADLVKPEDVRTYDDLLNPRWQEKIGLFDPRGGGAGLGMWTFLWTLKGEIYLKKLVQQKPLIGDRRPLADSLANGKIAITIGPTYYSFEPFIKAGLPLKPFPIFKEGTYVAIGNGGPVILKNRPHPNATKVFVNWLLSKEGQEIYSKATGHATRRLDVDTTWMTEIGQVAAKDAITVEQFHKWESQSEDKLFTGRRQAAEFAREAIP